MTPAPHAPEPRRSGAVQQRAHSFSFGVTSAEAAWRDVQIYGREAVRLYFADTLCEDEDTYRFGIEAAAFVMGTPRDRIVRLLERARSLTPLEANDMDSRRQELQRIAGEAQRCIPGLFWLQDGRTVWDVARDHRWVNNSRVCKATTELKARYLDAFIPADAVRCFGMDWDESHRIVRLQKRLKGAATAFPMAEEPHLWKSKVIEIWQSRGIKPPRMYDVGFAHGNCGGGCARAGKSAWLLLLRWNRARYLWHEHEELLTQVKISAPYTVLKETRNGVTHPLSLRELRVRTEAGDLFASEDDDWGACGCQLHDTEAA